MKERKGGEPEDADNGVQENQKKQNGGEKERPQII